MDTALQVGQAGLFWTGRLVIVTIIRPMHVPLMTYFYGKNVAGKLQDLGLFISCIMKLFYSRQQESTPVYTLLLLLKMFTTYKILSIILGDGCTCTKLTGLARILWGIT